LKHDFAIESVGEVEKNNDRIIILCAYHTILAAHPMKDCEVLSGEIRP